MKGRWIVLLALVIALACPLLISADGIDDPEPAFVTDNAWELPSRDTNGDGVIDGEDTGFETHPDSRTNRPGQVVVVDFETHNDARTNGSGL